VPAWRRRALALGECCGHNRSRVDWSRGAAPLSVCKLVEGHWFELGVYGRDERIRAEPFDAVKLSMADWWLPGAPAAE